MPEVQNEKEGKKTVTNDVIRPILLILGLAAFVLYSPLIIGVLLDASGGEFPRIIVRIVVLLLIGILITFGISHHRRKKAERSRAQTTTSGRE